MARSVWQKRLAIAQWQATAPLVGRRCREPSGTSRLYRKVLFGSPGRRLEPRPYSQFARWNGYTARNASGAAWPSFRCRLTFLAEFPPDFSCILPVVLGKISVPRVLALV